MLKYEQTDRLLIASCLGDNDTGGGLFSFDGQHIDQIDRLSSTGLCVAGDRLIRLLWSSGEGSVGELLVYDAHGVERYYRIDQLAEPHDIAWDGQAFVAVATLANSILWISPSGTIVRTWQASGNGDSWHLNSLFMKDGALFVAAFGRFQKNREWADRLSGGTGFVFNLATGQAILTGLSAPHHPRFVDSAWVVCNSALNEVLQISASEGAIQQRLQLNGWTRGIAISNDLLFIGESANRFDAKTGMTASIAIVSRRNWVLLDRIPLPCREIYDLVLVEPRLLQGIRRGFRTNPLRAAEQDQYAMFRQVGVEPVRLWATGDPLPPEACKVKIEADLPTVLEAESVVDLECTIENQGTAFFVSAPPNPIHISYKWLEAVSGTPVRGIEGVRSRLSQALPPFQAISCKFKVVAPPLVGDFILRVTLVQESVAWFDNLDVTNSISRPVQIVQKHCPPGKPQQ
jgi:acetolactate synthase-1/2/3 large subunit